MHLPRSGDEPSRTPLPTPTTGVRPALPHLLVILGAALLAGVGYGLASEWLGGSIAGIGVFYGTSSPLVGWITHEFHSIVFGFVFAALVSVAPRRFQETAVGYVAVGLGWALVLWVVAAGIIAPIWLQLLGIPASIPNLSVTLLVSHLVWGASLGLLTAVGYTHVTGPLASVLDGSRWFSTA